MRVDQDTPKPPLTATPKAVVPVAYSPRSRYGSLPAYPAYLTDDPVDSVV